MTGQIGREERSVQGKKILPAPVSLGVPTASGITFVGRVLTNASLLSVLVYFTK